SCSAGFTSALLNRATEVHARSPRSRIDLEQRPTALLAERCKQYRTVFLQADKFRVRVSDFRRLVRKERG
ncbi:MAG TPA: hypothetical protein VEA80_11670, partial [Vitreimonas sp.]|uniref:hypothetical protein n=1 Tax=Vitreimonas sp. TaxID=3069702 RepID=UPI002D55BA5B